jgi:hypothetical protein
MSLEDRGSGSLRVDVARWINTKYKKWIFTLQVIVSSRYGVMGKYGTSCSLAFEQRERGDGFGDYVNRWLSVLYIFELCW